MSPRAKSGAVSTPLSIKLSPEDRKDLEVAAFMLDHKTDPHAAATEANLSAFVREALADLIQDVFDEAGGRDVAYAAFKAAKLRELEQQYQAAQHI